MFYISKLLINNWNGFEKLIISNFSSLQIQYKQPENFSFHEYKEKSLQTDGNLKIKFLIYTAIYKFTLLTLLEKLIQLLSFIKVNLGIGQRIQYQKLLCKS